MRTFLVFFLLIPIATFAQHNLGDKYSAFDFSYHQGLADWQPKCGTFEKNDNHGGSIVYKFGYYTSPTLHVGGGIGTTVYGDRVGIPYFVTVAFDIGKSKKMTPFLSGRVGGVYLVNGEIGLNTGVSSDFEFGLRKPLKNKKAISFSLGYRSFLLKDNQNNSRYLGNDCHYFSNNMSFLLLKIGYTIGA